MENLELFEKAPNETVREYAYRVLYENIMSLKLPPGTAMSEQELSAGRRYGKPLSVCHKRDCSRFYRSAGPSYPRFTRNSWQSSAFSGLPWNGPLQNWPVRLFRIRGGRNQNFAFSSRGNSLPRKMQKTFSRVTIRCTPCSMKVAASPISGRSSRNQTWIMPGPASSTSAMPLSR